MSESADAALNDRRLTPANGRVAAAHLEGRVAADRFVAGTPARVAALIADLRRAPGGPRDRQLLLGAPVTVYETRDDHAFVQAENGYVGYLRAADLDAAGSAAAPNHWVSVPASHIHAAEDAKAPDIGALVFGARVAVVDERRHFFEIAGGGFVPKPHLWPLTKRFADPVTAAQLHFGAPYLWGGNSIRGLDCSGLVQAALDAAGRPCPGDSDLQETALGAPLPPDAAPTRGDLIFWTGHVGLMVDGETLLHANAHRMAVAYEPLAVAERRIAAQGGGPVTARRRLAGLSD